MTALGRWKRWIAPAVAGSFVLAVNGGWMVGPPIPRISIWMGAHPTTGAQIAALSTMKPSTPWTGVVYLRPSHLTALESRAQAVSLPSSPQYHHFLTHAQVVQEFAPAGTEVHAVEQTLARDGFQVEGSTGLGLGIRVAGTVGLINRTWAADLRRDREGRGIETRPVQLSGVLAESVSYISDLAQPGYESPVLVKKTLKRKRVPAITVHSATKNILVSAEGLASVPSGQNILVAISAVNPTTRFPLKGWNVSANPNPNAVLSNYQVSDLNGNLTLNKSGSDVLVLTSATPFKGDWEISISSGNVTYEATVTGLSWTGPTVISNNLSPTQVNTAYDANGLVSAAAAGGGMRIGIFADASPTLSDLTSFETRYHLPKSRVNVIAVDGGEKKPLSGWHGELMLDMERSVSSAPGATLDLYTVPPTGSITDAVAAAINQDVDQVFSISAVEPEDSLAPGHVGVWDALMAEGSLEGITFVAGSGDSGPYGDPSSSVADTNWPASSVWVTAVGGTQLGLNPTTDAIESQWAWSPDGLWDNQIDGSGGGYSRIQAVPAWQKGLVSATATGRGVPDIAFLAAQPYYAAIDNGVWEGMAGTSASTPTWAGWVADMDVLDGRQGFMNPTLYSTYTHDRSAFYAVVHGGNALYQAGPGWNPVTGLGSVVIDRYWQADHVAAMVVSASAKRVRAGSAVSVTVVLKNGRGQTATEAGVPVKIAAVGPSISVDGGAGGLGAVEETNRFGTVVFSVRSRQTASAHIVVTDPLSARRGIRSQEVTIDWTRAPAPLPPFVRSTSSATSADVLAESLDPTGADSGTAVVTTDAALSPKLALEAVALAQTMHGPLLFANRKGGLSTQTLATLRQLNIARVVVVGNLSRGSMDLPGNIAIASTIWTPSTASLFFQVAEAAVARGGGHALVISSAKAPDVLQVAAASLASHRKAGLLLVGPGALTAATLRAIAGEKTVWIIGGMTLPKSAHIRPIEVVGKSPLTTVLAVDRLDHAGPKDLVSFDSTSMANPVAAVLTAETAANWPSALVPVDVKGMPAPTQQYLGTLAVLPIENLFALGLTPSTTLAVEHALVRPLHHRRTKT